ncbi:NUDIX hydrolase [Leucobacter komagatae]|uniref:NUDIX hydrolase n=1 Tax=Leucobacter komagatae TaxID=55969 RepID=UPI0018DBADD1|nr:NUDIX domain-containing protein [Leucobacter komagatae]
MNRSRMHYQRASVAERRYLPPAVAVSVVAFALRPPFDAERGASAANGETTVTAAPATAAPATAAPATAASQAAPAAGPDSHSEAPTIWLPLVRRTRAPFLGAWALPGGPTEWDETLTDTALRTLRAAAGRDPGHLEQLYSFGGVERSAEAQRLVTIAYWAMYGEHEIDGEPSAAPTDAARAGAAPTAPARTDHASADPGSAGHAATDPVRPRRWDDPLPPLSSQTGGDVGARQTEAALEQPAGQNVAWFSILDLPPLAFDHAEIIDHAVERLRAKTEYAAVAHRFLGQEFTIGQLRTVTEAVLGQRIDPANFRRQALARGGLIDTGRLEQGGAHRPARLYRLADTDAHAGTSTDASADSRPGTGAGTHSGSPAPSAPSGTTPRNTRTNS